MTGQEEFLELSMEKPSFSVQVIGSSIGRKTVPARVVVTLLECLNQVIRQVCRVKYEGSLREQESVHFGEMTTPSINMTSLSGGSVAAIVGLELEEQETKLNGLVEGKKVQEKALAGLANLTTSRANEIMPEDYDDEVITAWLDMSILFNEDVDELIFQYRDIDGMTIANLT